MEAETFLDRIAVRLKRPRLVTAPPRTLHGVPEFHRGPSSGPDSSDLAARFSAALEKLGGRAFIEPSAAAASARLAALLTELRPGRIVAWAPEHLGELDLAPLLNHPGYVADHGSGWRDAALGAEIGVTGADYAVADTGTLVLASGPGRPRLASLAPAAHIALVPRARLVARIGEAWERVFREGTRPSAIQNITGPSRTADIENDLAIGVHGPASVTVILW